MTSTETQRVTAAEAARLLGVSRQRMLDLAASAADFPPARPTPTGGRVWPRMAVQGWAAAHPASDPEFTGPALEALFDHAPQLQRVSNFASREAIALNH